MHYIDEIKGPHGASRAKYIGVFLRNMFPRKIHMKTFTEVITSYFNLIKGYSISVMISDVKKGLKTYNNFLKMFLYVVMAL